VLPFGITLLTNFSTAPRICGTWTSSSPSAVCTCRGRFPFRHPRLRRPLVPSAAEKGLHLLFDRPLDRQSSSQPANLGQPLGVSQALGEQPLDGRLQLDARRYSLVHGVVLQVGDWRYRGSYAVLLFQRRLDVTSIVDHNVKATRDAYD